MLELVVPVVVLLVVLGVIAAVSVAALRRRRDAASGGPGPASEPTADGGTSAGEPQAEPWEPPAAAGPPPVAPETAGAPSPPPADRRASRGEGSRRRAAAPRVHVQPLSQEARERYLAAWQGVQTRATERPVLALSEADTIVARLLVERGLPSPEPRTAADRRVLESLPAAQKEALDSYRAGHALEQRNSSSRSDPDQVRQGMAHLSRAFQSLVEDDAATHGNGAAGPSSPADPRPRTGSE